MKCPKHNRILVPKRARYGVRRSCPEPGCTVVLWDGETSTPADADTRAWRRKAHNAFDPLWKKGHISRAKAYRLLCAGLNMPFEATHIGMMSSEQCRKTIAWCMKFSMEGDWKRPALPPGKPPGSSPRGLGEAPEAIPPHPQGEKNRPRPSTPADGSSRLAP